jgi:hypothetical protein
VGNTKKEENIPVQRFSMNNFVKNVPQEESAPQVFRMNNFTKSRKHRQ